MRSARGWVAAGALLLNVSAVDLASAGPWDACFQATKVDETIKACTREISRQLASGRAGKHDLAVAFFIRGKAMLKVDFDRAMMDFDKSTQIDPGIADVYDTRGVQFQYLSTILRVRSPTSARPSVSLPQMSNSCATARPP